MELRINRVRINRSRPVEILGMLPGRKEVKGLYNSEWWPRMNITTECEPQLNIDYPSSGI